MNKQLSLKKSQRVALLGKRDSFVGRATIDAALAQRVMELAAYREADVVLSYFSVGAEVDTREILKAALGAKKRVVLPRVVAHTRELAWYEVADFEHLVPSKFGVLEPDPEACAQVDVADPVFQQPSVALVPGLTFDVAGYRLGYGGGYYDTFLSRWMGTSVGLCREAFLCPSLAALGLVEPHDRRVGWVVSEAQTIRCDNTLQ